MTEVEEKRFKADKGGIVSNVDVGPVSPAERRRREEELANTDLIAEAIDEAKAGGGAAFTQYVEGEDVQVYATPERIKEKDFQASQRSHLVPVGMKWTAEHPRGFVWVLTDADQKSVEAGFYCENCLQLQRDPSKLDCKWQNSSVFDGGCGWVRGYGFGELRMVTK